MTIYFAQYTRAAGKRLTYDIEYWASGYRITLNEKVLKERDGVINAGGDVRGAEASLIHAQSAILHLTGMAEE